VSITRMMCAVGVLSVASTQACSQSGGHWLPDSKTVDRIEQAIGHMSLRKTGNWTETSTDSYGRYYTGVTLNGRKVVYGVFLSTDPTRYPPGIHIVPFEGQPHMTGGGCRQLNVWYDVSEERVTEFHCYGLG
jgi:hypothetical protein